MGRFTSEHDIFKDASVLSEGYVPEEIKERDDEISDFETAWSLVFSGDRADDVIVYGGVGVGKTMATKYMLDALEHEADGEETDIETIFLNVKSQTNYQATVRIVNSLIDDSEEKVPESGHQQSVINSFLWDELNNLDADQVIIALDEAESLSVDDDLIYQIPRAKANDHLDEDAPEVSLVLISNELTFREKLSSRARSTLRPQEIHFMSYNAHQLATILEDRVEKAFVDGAFPEGTLKKAAAVAANDTGSARTAIQLAKTGGKIARKNDAPEVRAEHIEEARKKIERNNIKNEMASLAYQRKLTLLAIAQLDYRNETPVSLNRVHEEYETICEHYDAHKLAQRTVHEKISDLQQVGIIETYDRNTGIDGGRQYQYDLTVDTDSVIDVFKDDSVLDIDIQNQQLTNF